MESANFMAENKSTFFKVKLYELEGEGSWVDLGTGFVAFQKGQSVNDESSLAVVNESYSAFLLQCPVSIDDIYERQGESIIMWREPSPSGDHDYALSFQDLIGCAEIWNAILTEQTTRASSGHSGHGLYGHHGQLQGVYEEPLLLYEDSQEMVGAVGAASSPGRHHRESRGGGYPGSGGGYRQQRQRSMSYDPALPPPTVQNLTLIRDTLQHGPGVPAAGALAFIKEAQASYLMQEEGSYIKQLMLLFTELEDRDDVMGVQMMADVFRHILALNDSAVLELLISDEMYMGLAGALEYDSLLGEQAQYRQYISSPEHLKIVMPGLSYANKSVTSSIHQLFRLKYLKDVMMRPNEELFAGGNSSSTMGSIICFSCSEICTNIFSDGAYLNGLFDIIAESDVITTGNDDPPSSSQGSETIGPVIGPSIGPVIGPSVGPDASSIEEGSASVVCENGIDIEGIEAGGEVASVEGGANSVKGDLEGTPAGLDNPKTSRRTTALSFLRELFYLSRYLCLEKRTELYTSLSANGILPDKFFGTLMHILERRMCAICVDTEDGDGEATSRREIASPTGDAISPHELVLVSDILTCFTIICPATVRSYLMESTSPTLPVVDGSHGSTAGAIKMKVAATISDYNGISSIDGKSPHILYRRNVSCLLFLLIRIVSCDVNPLSSSALEQLIDVIKVLVDVNRMSVAEKDTFLTIFYESYMPWLLHPFTLDTKEYALPSPDAQRVVDD